MIDSLLADSAITDEQRNILKGFFEEVIFKVINGKPTEVAIYDATQEFLEDTEPIKE